MMSPASVAIFRLFVSSNIFRNGTHWPMRNARARAKKNDDAMRYPTAFDASVSASSSQNSGSAPHMNCANPREISPRKLSERLWGMRDLRKCCVVKLLLQGVQGTDDTVRRSPPNGC